ncbi:hypothetical protein [Roseibium marinum]|nr:hypothetical protein [Roseibium marinum]
MELPLNVQRELAWFVLHFSPAIDRLLPATIQFAALVDASEIKGK